VLSSDEPPAPPCDPSLGGPFPSGLFPDRGFSGPTGGLATGCPGGVPAFGRNGVCGDSGRDVAPLPGLPLFVRGIPTPGSMSPEQDPEGFWTGSGCFSTHGAPLRQRAGPGGTGDGFQGGSGRGGPPPPGRQGWKCRLQGMVRCRASPSPAERPTLRRHRLPFFQPGLAWLSPDGGALRLLDP